MSGSTIISPSTFDTTQAQDGQAAGSYSLAKARQAIDSLSGLVVTTQSGNWTFVLTDRGTMVEGTSATAQTFTIPTNATSAFQIGTVIAFRQYGAGQITINGPGVTLRTSSSLTTRAQYARGEIHKRATDEWVVSGDMT